MNLENFKQHPIHGTVSIQMKGLMNNECSVLKLNGESVRVKEEDLTSASIEFKLMRYISTYGITVGFMDTESLKKTALALMQLEYAKYGEDAIDALLTAASVLSLSKELDEFICNF